MKHLIHRDQVHRDVEYDPLSRALIDSPQMQRLGKIYQLGFAHLVYRGGTHTRLSHVMGVAAVAETLVRGLKKNYQIALQEKCLPTGAVMPEIFLPSSNARDVSIEDRWDVLLYLAKWGALLHDIGHIPLGHTLEDEFADIYQKHDSFKSVRMGYLWNETASGQNSPIKAIFLNQDLYPPCFTRMNYQPMDVWQIVLLICLYKGPLSENEAKEGFGQIYDEAYKKHIGKRFHQYMADIVADTICADYMDYLHRDTLNVGLDPVKENRIIQNYFVGYDHDTNALRMALSLVDKGGKPKLSMVTAAKNMVRHRFDLAEIIYYHKTKVAASAMLAKVFSLIEKPKEIGEARSKIHLSQVNSICDSLMNSKVGIDDLRKTCEPDSLLHPLIGDESLILWLYTHALDKLDETSRLKDEKEKEKRYRNTLLALSLLESITERNLYKVLISIDANLVGGLLGSNQETTIESEIKKILKRYRPELSQVQPSEEKDRDKLERSMAESAFLPEGTFITYVPGRKAQAKGIETGALDRTGKVITLGKHSTVQDEVLILNESYKNLWKFLVFVHPDFRDNPIALSESTDTLLLELFPGINLSKVEEYIKQACYFTYIPSRLRLAAKKVMERDKENKSQNNWKDFLDVENILAGTTLPEEYAALYSLSSLVEPVHSNKVKIRFSIPGSLNSALKKEVELMDADSSKGLPEKENTYSALKKIADEISKDTGELKMF